MDVEAIDLGEEIRHGIESGFDLAPVVFRGPVTREFLHRRERHALREIRDGFLLGKPGRKDALAQVGEFRIGKVHMKRTNRILVSGLGHGVLLLTLLFHYCFSHAGVDAACVQDFSQTLPTRVADLLLDFRPIPVAYDAARSTLVGFSN